MRTFGPDGEIVGRRDHPGVRPAAQARVRLALALRPRAGGRGAQPRDVGDRAAATDGVCLLTVTHDQLEGAPEDGAERLRRGLDAVLSGLKTLLETGQPDALTAVRACCNPEHDAHSRGHPRHPRHGRARGRRFRAGGRAAPCARDLRRRGRQRHPAGRPAVRLEARALVGLEGEEALALPERAVPVLEQSPARSSGRAGVGSRSR